MQQTTQIIMTNFKFLTAVLLSTIFAFSSCKKDAVEVSDIKTKEVTLSKTTDYGEDWIYYSFVTEGEVDGVNNDNYKTSDNWDIAFNRYNVRTNGGNSGAELGGAYDAGQVGWATITEANESGYTVDGEIQIVEAFTGEGVNYMTSNGSEVFIDCIVREFGATGPVYASNEHVYVMKTANGKYAKIMITNFYNDLGDSGFLSFKYSYQNGNGRTFE